MSDPVSTKAAAAGLVSGGASLASIDFSVAMFGVPASVILAAFSGAALALSMLPPMTRRQMAIAVLMGLSVGTYGSLLAITLRDWPAHIMPAVGFFLGLGAQVGVSMLFKDVRGLAMDWIRKKWDLPAPNKPGGDS